METEDASTQLADNRPQFDTALRVALPVNVPQRLGKKSRDELIRANTFSPAALAIGKNMLSTIASTGGGGLGGSLKASGKISPPSLDTTGTINPGCDTDAQSKTAIKDMTFLAFSSKRANKKDVEATAYLSLGVIYDNLGGLLQAIDYYKLYLQICEEIGDVIGSALACNCIGVNYMTLVSPPTDVGMLQGLKKGVNSDEYLSSAIDYHAKHLDIGPDSGGRFIANSNLGLCYGMIGSIVQSAKHQQDALRIAIKMQTLYGQSIAVGNLGMLAMLKKDFPTSRTCFEQHLQLVQALADPEAEICAWKMLAKVSGEEDKLGEALEHLEQARRIASNQGCRNELRRIHCLIGMARGTLDFAAYTEHILIQMEEHHPSY